MIQIIIKTNVKIQADSQIILIIFYYLLSCEIWLYTYIYTIK